MGFTCDAVPAGSTPLAPADLYGLFVGAAPAPSLEWLRQVVDSSRLLGVGPRPFEGVPWVDEPRDRGTLPSTVTGLLHLRALDPDALVVVVHGQKAPRPEWLHALVRALAAVVEDPDRCVTLAAPSGDGGWLYTHPGATPDRWGARPALTYRAPRAAAPADALRDAGVLVGEARTLLRRFLASSPCWSRGLVEGIWSPDARERLYRSLPATSLEQALERDPEELSVVPVVPTQAPFSERPARPLPLAVA